MTVITLAALLKPSMAEPSTRNIYRHLVLMKGVSGRDVNVCNDLSGDEVEDYSAALQAAKRSLSQAEPPPCTWMK
jgi:hypothetical protein